MKARYIVLCLATAGAVAGASSIHYVRAELPVIRSLADYSPRQASRVMSQDGQLIGQFFNERRTVVAFSQIPSHVVHAFLAAEDAGFYTHEGIDYWGIARAVLKNLRPGAHLQGASTITQQTVKTLVLGPERSYTRKLREALLARQLEQMLGKDEILALYLNQIYFGNGAWGIEEAAQSYFGKGVAQLNLSEAALLAAIPKNPGHYNIKSNPAAAKARRGYVLQQMQNHGWADASAVQQAAGSPVGIAPRASDLVAMSSYYVEHVRRLVAQKYGDTAMLEGGLHITVGMQAKQQAAAFVALRQGIEDVSRKHGYPGAPVHIAAEHLDAVQTALAQEFSQQVARRAAPTAPEQFARGYIWDLTGVTPSMARDASAARRGLDIVPLVDYARVRGLVVALDPVVHQATVDLGSHRAALPLRHMAWARRLSPRRMTPLPRDPSQVFRVGDIITVEVLPQPSTQRQSNVYKGQKLTVALIAEPTQQGALVAIEPTTRWVRALVGGYAPDSANGFNRATQALRQPGSAFKPILYGAALQARLITPASICPDSPIVIPDPWTGRVWRPDNFEDGRYDGNITYRTALVRSKNTCSVRLIQKVGPEATIAMGRAMGIISSMPRNLTLALGTGDNTVLELCNAYTTIASGGFFAPPQFITSITDAVGHVLEDNRAPIGEPAMQPATAYVLTSLMRSVIDRGTAQRALTLERPLAGKTGTSQESRNVWFAGFAPQLVASVWMGFDNNDPLGFETGSSAALPAWIRFMGAALANAPAVDFAMPEHVVTKNIDPVTGVASEGPGHVPEVFIEGTEPEPNLQSLPSIYLQDDDETR